jgi:hypothetical protein
MLHDTPILTLSQGSISMLGSSWYYTKERRIMETYIIIGLLVAIIGLLLLNNKEASLKHKELLNKIQLLDNEIKDDIGPI